MVQPATMGRKKGGLWQSVLIAFLFALALFILFKSTFFDIKVIEVRGNNVISKEKIISTSGLYTGVNIFKVNLKQARSKLELMPVFKNIRLERDFPAGIIIKVEERVPVALLPVEDGFIEVDGEMVYIRKSRSAREGIPFITGLSFSPAGPGNVVEGRGLKTMLQVIEHLPAELVEILSEVHWEKENTVILYTVGGKQCRLGRPVQIESKGSMFLEILREVEKKNRPIEYVDLSFIGSPVIKYK